MPRLTIRGIIGLTAISLIIAIYRAAKGEWSGLAIFGFFTAIMLVVILIMVLIYYIKYQMLIRKLNHPYSQKTRK